MKKSDEIWIDLMEFGHRIGCHQMESRSFSINGYQFPVCARCTGVILGEIVVIILLFFSVKINFVWSVILLLCMGVDWFIQYINILQSNNIRRLITGLMGGIGLTYIYYYLSIYLINILIDFFK